jgi:hypothetical protein
MLTTGTYWSGYIDHCSATVVLTSKMVALAILAAGYYELRFGKTFAG